MSALRQIFCIFLFLFLANLFIFIKPVSAAPCIGSWCPLSTENYQDELATQRFGRNILVFGMVTLSGKNPLDGQAYSEKVAISNVGGQTVLKTTPGVGPGDTQGGAIGMATNTIASIMASPPTSSQEYLANLGENIGLSPKPAYAQVTGSGQNVIQPVLALWQVTRNIAYTGFILVFMAAGVMIMFRQRLNPQTVIGIQQALPGIVVGLILVTFSYFIAALIVDLSFVGTRLVTEVFVGANYPNYFGCTVGDCSGGANAAALRATYQSSDAFNMFQRVALRVNNVVDVFRNVWATLTPADNTQYQNGELGYNLELMRQVSDEAGNGPAVFGDQGISGILGLGTATLASLLVPLILMIALLIQFIRLIIALLMTYLQILLMVIFGPILIMVSAIPGRGGSLNFWLKGLFANALVFPAVFAGFLFAGLLLEWNTASGNFNSAMPMFGGLSGDILKSLLAFGVLLGLPSIPDIIRDALGVKAPAGFIKAAVGGFMGGIAAGRGGYNQAMERTGIRTQQQARQKAEIETAAGAYEGGAVPIDAGRGWGRLRYFLTRNAP